MEASLQTAPAPAAPPVEAPPTHLNHVEGLRAIAAYIVYVNHAYAQSWPPPREFPAPMFSFLSYFLVWGHLSVTVFIVISGFCLTLPVVRAHGELRGGTMAFMKRRARRILPPYYGAVALCLLLIFTIIGKPTGTLWDVPIHVTPVAVISHLLLIQDIFGTSKINYVFWSIAVEWQIYFLFPALVWSWRRYGARVTVAVAMVLGYALRFGFADTRLVRAAPQYIGCFALGMLAAFIGRSPDPAYARARDRLPWDALCLLGLTTVGVMSWSFGLARAVDAFQFLDLPTAIAAMCMLVATSKPGSRAAAALSWKPLVWVGTFSYSVYLVHAPLIQVVWQYVIRPARLGSAATFLVLMGPGAVVILGGSYAFFKVLEEPFIRQAKLRMAARSDAAPELRTT